MPTPIPSALPENIGIPTSHVTRSRRWAALYLHTVPPVGGDTLFASQYAAYDALSTRMKAYLEGLTATHSGDHVYRATNVLVGRDDRGKVFAKASHPVIRTHPVTKRKALYVNQGFTTHIDGLPKKGEPCHPELSIRALHPAGIPSAVPLAAPLGRILGQSQRSAHGVVGLLPPGPLRSPRDDQGRQAVLSRRWPIWSRLRQPDPARSLFPEHRLICSAGVMGHIVFKFDRNPQGSAAEPKRPLIGIADRRTSIASTIEPCSRAVRRPGARNI